MENTGDARGFSYRIAVAFSVLASLLGIACTNGGANVGSTRSDEGRLSTDGGVASVDGFAWLVQLGGAGADQARGIAANADGVYVLGQSRRANGEPGEGSSSGGGESFDVWVRQIELTGELGWERWIGSAEDDHAGGIALDARGNLYVVGHTDGALRGDTRGASDAFVTKLDAGGAVVWTLRLGAADGATWASAVSVDPAGNVYVAGSTVGTLGERHAGADDVFVRKLDPDGEALWTTQLGTTEIDRAHGIATDAGGYSYVVGETRGSLGQDNVGESDAFVGRIDPDGTVIWTEQRGSERHDHAASVALGTNAAVLVAGGGQVDFPSVGVYVGEGFLRRVGASGNPQWTVQFDEADDLDIRALATDSGGNAYVAGNTGATLGELSAGRLDAFVRKFDSSTLLEWTRQFGTALDDGVHALAVGPDGTLFVAGNTDGSFGGEARGGPNVFVGALEER